MATKKTAPKRITANRIHDAFEQEKWIAIKSAADLPTVKLLNAAGYSDRVHRLRADGDTRFSYIQDIRHDVQSIVGIYPIPLPPKPPKNLQLLKEKTTGRTAVGSIKGYQSYVDKKGHLHIGCMTMPQKQVQQIANISAEKTKKDAATEAKRRAEQEAVLKEFG